ncbi:hypothetical protein [Blastopirellula marina]|uniref:hypothetical protein n=1 Tax=Blastopirellula marina TaxID=124 RepID=UPI0011B0AD38|nr:hypothetical protein [Blastopirellula marina]
MPKHLGNPTSKKYAAAQCKRTDELGIKTIRKEVKEAESFKPKLTEYVVMTTTPRDASLQEDVRCETWPFETVHVMFWEDISLKLSGFEDLLQKHYPGWMKKTTTEEQVLNRILSSTSDDFNYDDGIGQFFHKSDVNLRIVFDRSEAIEQEFHEPWVTNFSNPEAWRQPVYIYYGETRVKEVYCVYVDGARHIIPIPKSPTELEISPFAYHLGTIINKLHDATGYGFDYALGRAGISIGRP